MCVRVRFTFRSWQLKYTGAKLEPLFSVLLMRCHTPTVSNRTTYDFVPHCLVYKFSRPILVVY